MRAPHAQDMPQRKIIWAPYILFKAITHRPSIGTALRPKKGNAHAQFNLGLLYELGRGLPKDLEKAQDWYKLAAAQGHWDAQYKLARLNDDDLPPLLSNP